MFQNREEAGKLLAAKLKKYKDDQKAIVLAIPRGGVVVGKQIASILKIPLSIIVVKKLGAPYNPELAIGALAPDNVKVIDWDLAVRVEANQEYLDNEIKKKQREVEERVKKFKIQSASWRTKFKIKKATTIILVDDGVATGATTLAAIKYIKYLQPTTIILAVSVIAKDTYERIKSEVDELVALEIPEYFGAVGEFYREFPQVTDEEVIKMIRDKR